MKTTKIILIVATFFVANSLKAQLKVLGGGRVGIGTNDVSFFKLHVNAPNDVMALKLRNTIYNWGHISQAEVNGALTCAWVVRYNNKDNFFVTGGGLSIAKLGFWTSSDVNLKENIITVNDALNKIKLLRGVYFNYKTEQLHDSAMGGTIIAADLKRYMGLIAQEVEPIIPEVVITDNTGRKSVAYQNLIGLLIEGMKDQQNQIELLTNQVSICCGYSPAAFKNYIKNGKDTTLVDTLKIKSPLTGGSLGKGGNTTGVETNEDSYGNKLFQNNPNPFNQNTTINFEIVKPFSKATLYVYNYQGEQLKAFEIYTTGKGSINIKGSDFKAGIYLYDLIVDNNSVGTKKMILTQ
jgi:hypothetical protein